MARRLWWLPEVDRGGLENSINEVELAGIAEALATACVHSRSLMSAFDLWLDREDYRFCGAMVAAGLGESARIRLRESQAASIAALHSFVQQTVNAVEDAVLDGVVLDRRAEFLGRLSEVDPVEDPNRVRDPVLRFSPAREKVHLIASDLKSEREGRLTYFRQRWQNLRDRLLQKAAADADPVVTFVDRVQTQTRVLSECLSDLAAALDIGGDLREHLKALSWMTPAVGRDEVAEFLAFADSREVLAEDWCESLLKDMSDPTAARSADGSRVPGERRGEVERAANAWIRLRQRRSLEQDIVEGLREILIFLDLTLTEELVPVERWSNDSVSLFVYASAGEGAQPFWQFGSESKGSSASCSSGIKSTRSGWTLSVRRPPAMKQPFSSYMRASSTARRGINSAQEHLGVRTI